MSTEQSNSLEAEFSVIIPTLDNPEMVIEIITSLEEQTLPPKEIVFCDSSSTDHVHNVVKDSQSKILLSYYRLGRSYKFDRFLTALFSFKVLKIIFPNYKVIKGRAYPYEASNFGAKVACYKWLAFLDASTKPSKDWLEDHSARKGRLRRCTYGRSDDGHACQSRQRRKQASRFDRNHA